jgi:rhamnogalacturonan endolyase
MIAGSANAASKARFMEKLTRGLVAVKSGSGYFLSWRLFGTEQGSDIAFNVYKGTAKLNSAPITNATCYLDNGGGSGDYSVKAVVGGAEQEASPVEYNLSNSYISIPLQNSSGYSAGDCSCGDLNGDGQYEIVVKEEKSPKDNAYPGVSGSTKLAAYTLAGKFMWRIEVGVNIREGAHYTQFMVYDLDGDGIAEVAIKTAPGTKDGTGSYLKTGPAAGADNTVNLVNADGKILTGPEWYTIFNGKTGAELVTVEYKPLRGAPGVWGAVAGFADPGDMGWGNDANGNFVDRFLACVCYLDGERPSVVPCRGYYWRTACWALDWRNGKLTERWLFDTDSGGPGKDGKKYKSSQGYMSQGAHSIREGDIDGDGFDEICMGSSAIDHDGIGLYSTSLRHGDAYHMADMDPDRPGMEIYMVHEQVNSNGGIGADFHDAATGKVYWTDPGSKDVGRGCCGPVTAGQKGWQMWSGAGGLWDVNHKKLGGAPSSQNFAIWWGADLTRAPENGTSISPVGGGASLSVGSPCAACNGTKSTPALSADLFGDWREEIVYSCGSELRVYTTTTPTTNRLYTLMHDPVYRMSVCSENVAYNQPPEPGIYIGPGMTLPQAKPNIKYYGEVEAKESAKPFHGPTPINHSLKVFGDRTIVLPFQFNGMQKLVSVYDCSGKLVHKAVIQNNEVNLQRDFGVSDGVYMVRVSPNVVTEM